MSTTTCLVPMPEMRLGNETGTCYSGEKQNYSLVHFVTCCCTAEVVALGN